jgi:hypothetical protein
VQCVLAAAQKGENGKNETKRPKISKIKAGRIKSSGVKIFFEKTPLAPSISGSERAHVSPENRGFFSGIQY